MAEFVAAQASVLIVPTLGKGANSFHTKLKGELQKVRESVDVQVNADTTRMMAEVQTAKTALERDPINLRVAVDNDGFKTLIKDVQHIQTVYQDLKSDFKKGLFLNLKVVGLSTLNMAASAVGALNTSLVQLSQSALVVPGIMAGLASSLAAGVIGSRGLADAFKAQAKATKDATDSARQQRDANKAVRDSTRDLNNAIKDAKRNLQDLNDQLRDAPLDEAEAMMNLAEAQAEANNRLGKSAFELQKDQLRLRRAENELADTRKTNGRLAQDVAEANKKGIAGNDAVVAATERLTAALEDQRRGADAVNELADAMAKLSPNAQDFVNKVKALGGAWDELRNAVQDRLFANLGDDVTTLAGKSLPMLQKGLSDVAGSLNGNLRTALRELGSDQNQGFLENIFGNTAEAGKVFDQAIKPLLDGILRLSSVGSDYLPRLSDAFGDVMRRFDNFITRADEDGSLDRWIDQGLTSLTELGNTLLNIASIMNTVSEAFTGAGGTSVTKWLEDNTKRLADFLKGPEGQQKLRDMFANARAEFSKWEPVLKTIPGIIKNIATAAQNWADIVMPFLTTVAPILRDHPGLVMAIFTAYMSWKTFMPIIKGVNTLIGTDTGLVGAAKRAGRSIAAADGLTGKMRAFGQLIGPGGLVMGGLTVLAGFLINDWVNAQQTAADAVQHHADMVDLLKQNLDSLSGSMTQQGLINTINGLSSWTDPRGNRRDIPMIAKDLGLTDQFTRAVNPTDQAGRNQFSGSVREQLRQELGPKLKETVDSVNHERDSRGGDSTGTPVLTEDAFLDALLSGPQTRTDFAKKYFMRETLDDFIFGSKGGPLGIGSTSGLSDRAKNLISLNAATNEAVDSGLVQGDLNRTLGLSLSGQKAEFQPNSPFSQLGSPRAFYNINRDGGAVIEVDTPPDKLPPDLKEKLGDYNITPLANGSGSHIVVDPELAKQFLVPAFASGGMFRGPGSGTSDSILARVSNGEFITRASVVERNPELFHALNAGLIDPAMLPAFAGGTPFPLDIPALPGGPTVPPGYTATNGPTNGFVPAIAGAPMVPWDQLSGGGAQVVSAPRPPTQYRTFTPPAPKPAVKPAAPASTAPSSTGTPHLTGAVPGPTQHLTGPNGSPVLPGPSVAGVPGIPGTSSGSAATVGDTGSPLQNMINGWNPTLTPSVNDPMGLAGLPDNLQPVSILEQAGEILLSAVLGFFGIDPTYFNIGKKIFTGLTGKSGDRDKQNAAVPGVDGLLGVNPYDYYGISQPGTAQLVPNANSTDYLGSMSSVASQFGLSLTSGMRDEAGSLHSTGTAGDFSNGSGNTPEMEKFANFMADNYAPYITELIYDSPTFNKTIKDGKIVGKFGEFYTMAQAGNHQNHVHLAVDMPPMLAQQAFNQYQQQAGVGGVAAPVGGGAAAWRPNVQQAVANVAAQYGITNQAAVVEDILGQIDFESKGDAGALNPNDSDGLPAIGLGQFKQGTFNAHNITGGSINDGNAQIYAMIDYLASGKYGIIPGGGVNWKGVGWRNGMGYANGGLLRGPGNGTSDSILARVSNGEFITKASVVSRNPALFSAFNSGALDPAMFPGFADGTPVPLQIAGMQPQTPQQAGPLPPPAAPMAGPPGPDPQAPQSQPGQPPVTDTAAQALGGISLGGTSAADGAQPGAEGPEGANPEIDPRSILGAAPANTDHNNPALSKGIQGAFSTVGSIASMAASAALSAGTMGAGAAAAGPASSGIQAGAQMAGQVATGALNILSSLLVGTAPGQTGTTQNAYGAPVLPQGPPQSQPRGPAVVNNYGDIHTANYEEFHRGQQRREAQTQAPFLPMR
ncbi:tape measure protein [Mycobacterium phage Nicholas]|uniref:tail length tape measure protein n=1 Tax=Mycobacterium phage Snenia TaxID=1698714 RepID=UPI0006CE3A3C|nr:tail length tape measure protein [Mycobacterium phage Snenia]ALF01473.1 tape measure protein [Mycobacterium phage Snenia]ASR86947.1 tape measure protein [Mycobacterium phage Kingsolomon]ASR87289.1 tape measure protein [Mycobacterium phage Nicholas]